MFGNPYLLIAAIENPIFTQKQLSKVARLLIYTTAVILVRRGFCQLLLSQIIQTGKGLEHCVAEKKAI